MQMLETPFESVHISSTNPYERRPQTSVGKFRWGVFVGGSTVFIRATAHKPV